MGRSKQNKDKEVANLYNEGYGIEEISKIVGYTENTIKHKLMDMQIYDRPITNHYLEGIWGRWQSACNMLR